MYTRNKSEDKDEGQQSIHYLLLPAQKFVRTYRGPTSSFSAVLPRYVQWNYSRSSVEIRTPYLCHCGPLKSPLWYNCSHSHFRRLHTSSATSLLSWKVTKGIRSLRCSHARRGLVRVRLRYSIRCMISALFQFGCNC